MKIPSALAIAAILSFGTAVAAPPPTAMPGAPSGLVPIQHPAYKGTCIAGFTPGEATSNGSSWGFQCMSAQTRCAENLKFVLTDDANNPLMGLNNNKALYYTCDNWGASSPPYRLGSLTCANGFTAGAYDAVHHWYKCTSQVVTCSGATVFSGQGGGNGTDRMYYNCATPT